jgi:hypothetical protein
MLVAYIDDSIGRREDQRLFLAGYLTRDDIWPHFCEAWIAELDRTPAIKHFHMVEAQNCAGPSGIGRPPHGTPRSWRWRCSSAGFAFSHLNARSAPLPTGNILRALRRSAWRAPMGYALKPLSAVSRATSIR